MRHIDNTRADAAPRAHPQDEGIRAKEIAMSAEIWATISFGIVILIAIATSHRALRRELNERMAEMRREMNERFKEVIERLDRMIEHLRRMNEHFGEPITDLRAEMNERFGELGERLGRVEGFLERMGYAPRKPAGKERRDSEHGSARPPA